MDEASGRGKHRFAGQRTCFEGSKVVVKHADDVVNEFFWQCHTLAVGGKVEVDRPFPHLCLSSGGTNPSAEYPSCVAVNSAKIMVPRVPTEFDHFG